MALNLKQQSFIDEYIVDKNATQAAIRAGYSKKTAHSQGPRLLENDEIRAAIDSKLAKISKQSAKNCGITQEWCLNKLKQIVENCVDQTPQNAVNALNSIRDTLGFKSVDKKELDLNVKIITGVPDPE